MFAFNLKKYILAVKEKIVLKNFGMLAVDNKQVSVSLPIINPCISVLPQRHTKCEGFLFWFVIPLNLKTGLKIACSVSAITTSDLENPSMDKPTVKWIGSSKLNIGLWFLEATSLISREKNRYARNKNLLNK